MKFEVTLDKLYEMAMCISDCDMGRDEACEYVKSCVTEDFTDICDTNSKHKEE